MQSKMQRHRKCLGVGVDNFVRGAPAKPVPKVIVQQYPTMENSHEAPLPDLLPRHHDDRCYGGNLRRRRSDRDALERAVIPEWIDPRSASQRGVS